MSYSSSNHSSGRSVKFRDLEDGAGDASGSRTSKKTLDKLAENATTICITHHLGDLKTSDDVIYLDAGHIVEHGSFDELMKAKGTFYDQVNARGDE